MCKRVMIGLFAMSVVAMWWTEADAATCSRWSYIGGSKVCTKWRTKGVMVGVGFDGFDCGLKGEACKVKANAKAEANHSFAFCKNNMTGKIRRVKLPVPLSFSGSADGCDPGDDVSDKVSDDVCDDVSDTVCSATIVLVRQTECQIACTDKETCIDATPFDMKTSVDLCIGIGLNDCIEPKPPACSEESPICTIKEQCTIGPNKIAFNRVKRFRCEQQ